MTEAVAEGLAAAGAATTCDLVISADPVGLYRGVWPFPAVVGMRDDGTEWGPVGAARYIDFSDGGGVRAIVVASDTPHSFAYDLDELSGRLARIMTDARVEWRFERVGLGDRCRVRWSYRFTPRSRWSAPIVALATLIWRREMRRLLPAFLTEAESHLSERGPSA